jgi:exonuclease III
VIQTVALLGSIMAGLSDAHHPRGTCIYAVRDDATFLYIGKTMNRVWQRVRGHVRSTDTLSLAIEGSGPVSASWRVEVCNFLVEPGAPVVERELIRRYRPLLNQAHNTGRALTPIEQLQLLNRTMLGPSCQAVLDNGWPSFLHVELESIEAGRRRATVVVNTVVRRPSTGAKSLVNGKEKQVRLISWNVQRPSAQRIESQVLALQARHPDIVALQEVTAHSALAFRSRFTELGLPYVTDSFALAPEPSLLVGPRQYGELLASRWPLLEVAPDGFPIPWPERVLSAIVESPWDPIEIHTTHVPHGSSHGWLKIDTLEGIYSRLACRADHPRILCGDLNTPQQELPSGEVVTWGQDILSDGVIVLEGTWRDPAGREDTSERWDRGERNVLRGLAAYDLADVYRSLHGYTTQEFSWYWSGRGRQVGRRFDHIFASSLGARLCSYLHTFRKTGLSDHAPIEVVFAPAANDGQSNPSGEAAIP